MKLPGLYFACIALFVGCAHAQTDARRGIAGAASSLSDLLERQAAANAEIEMARAKAEIEIETHRRMLAMSRQAPAVAAPVLVCPPAAAVAPMPVPAPAPALDPDEAMMEKRHPQWRRIVTSSVFTSWLKTRPASYQRVCRTTGVADVMASCIDDLFASTVLKVK